MADDPFAVDRRTMLAAGSAAMLAASTSPLSAATEPLRFPRGFRWGASTAMA